MPYGYRGLKIFTALALRFQDFQRRLAQGFVYLVAIIDWYSRKVLAWQVSNTMDANFCVDGLVAAINEYGVPEIFNTDQGSQFTSERWIRVLQENAIKISMDRRGCALDNIFVERLWRSVKYEDVYPKNYASMPELLVGLVEYFFFYNGERFHQALGYKTPDQVYRTGDGGGAKIVDHSLRDRSRVVPRSDRACVFTERFLRSENAGFPKSRRVIAITMLHTPCWVCNE